MFLDLVKWKNISRIWLNYWTLFLEIWLLDNESWKWEISFMIEPTRRFQSGFEIKENCNQNSKLLNSMLLKYIWNNIKEINIDGITKELIMDLWDVYFITHSNGWYDWDILAWTIFLNHHISNSNNPWSYLTSDKIWLFYVNKKSPKLG